jgi:hypothetical protein
MARRRNLIEQDADEDRPVIADNRETLFDAYFRTTVGSPEALRLSSALVRASGGVPRPIDAFVNSVDHELEEPACES